MSNDIKTTTFDDEQYAAAYPDGMSQQYWQLARTSIVAKTLSQLESSNSLMLEVGCGRGFMVDALRTKGFNVFGVELAEANVLPGAEEFVYSSTDALSLSRDFRESVRSILLLDVIEHIPDPVVFLNELKEHFPNARRFLLTVPARQEIWSNFDDYFGHHRRYDLDSAQDLAKTLDAKIVKARYFFHVLYFIARLIKSMGIKRSIRFTPPRGRAQIVINRVLAMILKFEFRLSLNRVPGTSILLSWEFPQNAE